ncbi:MAG: phosphoribosylanthranilate isomerase [Syntrophobacteraceae bacterium]
MKSSSCQIKVCGLTVVEEAIACAEAGADALGLVFYPPSSRFVSAGDAREICANIPGGVCTVGVFVDAPIDEIMKMAELCGLDFAQLHGCESPAAVAALEAAGIAVIKTLFTKRQPYFSEADSYPASAYLVESGGGTLPGGAGLRWEWSGARGLAAGLPCILAGGLTPQNVCEAINEFAPAAVDVSSGVESAPGRKDMKKVRAFIEEVRKANPYSGKGRVFQCRK